MNRRLVTTVVVGSLTFTVYLVAGSASVANKTAWLVNDAGITTVTHAATCPVRISPDCVDAGRNAGLNVHSNERLRFPVSVRVMPDGGRDVQLPPMNETLAGRCIEVTDWADCQLDNSAGARTSAAALLGQELPFDLAGVVRKCVRAKFDAGLQCSTLDGGTWGDRNVFPRANAQNPAQCEEVECSVYAGDDPEVAL